MEYLGIDVEELKEKGAYHTAKEIESQPKMWLLTYDRIKGQKDSLYQFLNKALEDGETCTSDCVVGPCQLGVADCFLNAWDAQRGTLCAGLGHWVCDAATATCDLVAG